MTRLLATSRILLTALLAWAGAVLAAQAQGMPGLRLALVVGNANYQAIYPLKNAVNDSRAVADALDALGFTVTLLNDGTRAEIDKAIDDMAKRAKAEGAQATLLYYSGHGFQLGGANYIVPVDAVLDNRDKIAGQTVRLDDIIARLESPDRQTIILLDACRDNPLPASVRGNDARDGLAEVRTGVNTYIAFATAPGAVSLDGKGEQGPFAEALVRNVSLPDISVSDMMSVVRTSVRAQTKGMQLPWENNTLFSPFYFNPGTFNPDNAGVAFGAMPGSAAPAAQGFEGGVTFGATPGPKVQVATNVAPGAVVPPSSGTVVQPVFVDPGKAPTPSSGTVVAVEPQSGTPAPTVKAPEPPPQRVADVAPEARSVSEPGAGTTEAVTPNALPATQADAPKAGQGTTETQTAALEPGVPRLAPLEDASTRVIGVDVSDVSDTPPGGGTVPGAGVVVTPPSRTGDPSGLTFLDARVSVEPTSDGTGDNFHIALTSPQLASDAFPSGEFGVLVDYRGQSHDPDKVDLVRLFVAKDALVDKQSRDADFTKCDDITYGSVFPSIRLHFGAESRLNACILAKLGPNDRRIWSEVFTGIDLAVAKAAEGGDPAAVKLNDILDGQVDLALSVQTELKRLGCYTGGLDGDWGNGSRSALRRFYDKVDVASLGEDPTRGLVTRLMQQDGTVCEPPAVVATPEPTPPKKQPQTAQPRKPQAPAQPPKTVVTQETPPAKPKINLGGGSGVFR